MIYTLFEELILQVRERAGDSLELWFERSGLQM